MQVVSFRTLAGVGVIFLAGVSLCFIGLPEAFRVFQLSLQKSAITKNQNVSDIITPLDEPQSLNRTAPSCSQKLEEQVILQEWDSSRFLQGPPTQQFRKNLRDDTFYITAWSNSGFTNQFMGYVNMIYLGMISDRVPIIPPFGPHHISYDAGSLRFSSVFNLTRARRALKRPLLEWHELKEEDSPTSLSEPLPDDREPLGCWSARHEGNPTPIRVKSVIDHLKLDTSYTRVPSNTRHFPDVKTTDFLVFNQLVPYIFPRHPWRPSSSFPLMEASPLGQRLPPDEQLSCFDFLYYVTSSRELFEWQHSWSPAWRSIATHLRFTDALVDLAQSYLRRAFQFIAVHMRRGDFGQQCRDGRTSKECFVPLENYRKAVESMQQELRDKKGIDVKDVVLMSDEKDQKFWDETKELGWARLDHHEEQTVEKYGEWYPLLLDNIAQSLAAGFVGTGDSTYSLLSARRVEDWNGGPTFMVQRFLGARSLYYEDDGEP
ncbi:hypothetical protein NLJ89_g18 [Agrocybe chaxingu]|uniref:GDP-fucose protein O-fucosyltransferase 2 n=1 Tax=Agrocybe chaxingu TaxID=84603 RepID=A0A9W8N2P6_9AGAR|nr:hypothetical protein NLJ89_g18 [Agrocybe chaxingu]